MGKSVKQSCCQGEFLMFPSALAFEPNEMKIMAIWVSTNRLHLKFTVVLNDHHWSPGVSISRWRAIRFSKIFPILRLIRTGWVLMALTIASIIGASLVGIWTAVVNFFSKPGPSQLRSPRTLLSWFQIGRCLQCHQLTVPPGTRRASSTIHPLFIRQGKSLQDSWALLNSGFSWRGERQLHLENSWWNPWFLFRF